MFDFLLVLASIFGILMEDIMIDLPISPTLLRVVRVFRIGRILRLIKVRLMEEKIDSGELVSEVSVVLEPSVDL
jgi:hypothetical protein